MAEPIDATLPSVNELEVALLLLGEPAKSSRPKAIGLLRLASRDGDYPEADSILRQLSPEVTELSICRCRRGLSRDVKGQAVCHEHRPV